MARDRRPLHVRLRAAFFLAATGVGAACGARTGLEVDLAGSPSASPDATDAEVEPAVGCTPGRFDLSRAVPAVMFVLDRSTSMSRRTSDGRSRWSVLTRALEATLPPVDTTMEIGALVFPTSGRSSCTAPSAPDLLPGPGNVASLVSLVRANGPSGSTPTAPALDAAATALLGTRAASRARALVLATDGAPACNADLAGTTCRCISGSCASRPQRCLDDARTVERIGAHLAQGIPTYVVGIQDADNALMSDVLDAMAVAGGRPKTTGARRYYAAASEAELELAIVTIRDQVSACTYLTSSVPSADGTIVVTLDGVSVPYDPSGASGWRWGDRGNGEILLAGDACGAAAAEDGSALVADVSCDPADASVDASADDDDDASVDASADDDAASDT
ncbi:MAG: VWA domain-containing protein [Labilithrix sp.]|nr:VWA domain-containing protein [Labilithrix sp.]